MATTTNANPPPESLLNRYKYHLLIGSYLALTSLFFYRVHRRPFSTAIKSEQYETIFKGTTLAAVVGGVAMSSSGRAKYRQYRGRPDDRGV
ncbi:Uu.00g093420.m01.CDS01 [Anthostomella pinea]|uniref:Uu.00g093420.m01.CDS01 n=1 Tax=Anthostomella pinea TaxID=933095 RepID=A0AAI8VPE5_9PEZI|nr:Uu.00g093420.m01.CDS01 [Anthostomella pinea]